MSKETKRTKLLSIIDLRDERVGVAGGSVKNVAGVVGALLGDSPDKAATGVDSTSKDVQDRVTGLLARDTSVQDSSDVGVVEPGLNEDGADNVHDDDGVGAVRRSVEDELVAAVPQSQVVTVTSVAADVDVALAGVCVREDEAGGGLLGSGIDGSVVVVAEDALDDRCGVLLVGIGLDRGKGVDEVREVGS